MDSLKLPVLTTSTTPEIQVFISYWQKLYAYGQEDLYSDNINVNYYTPDNIKALFIWKNGTVLSGLKEKSLDKNILQRLITVNDYKKSPTFSYDDFTNDFKSLSAVWRIFLLHIVKPDVYPIYDQHIHRTYQYLHGLPIEHIRSSMKDELKLNFYKHQYLPFINKLAFHDLKKMDEAFFAFGQFLNTRSYSKIITDAKHYNSL